MPTQQTPPSPPAGVPRRNALISLVDEAIAHQENLVQVAEILPEQAGPAALILAGRVQALHAVKAALVESTMGLEILAGAYQDLDPRTMAPEHNPLDQPSRPSPQSRAARYLGPVPL